MPQWDVGAHTSALFPPPDPALWQQLHGQFYCLITHIQKTTESFTKFLYYKWENHFPEMKGDVGMSLHKKEREQEDA